MKSNTNPCGRTRCNDVAGTQGHAGGSCSNDTGDIENQIAGIRVLPPLTIDPN